jgi:hypothetical protein
MDTLPQENACRCGACMCGRVRASMLVRCSMMGKRHGFAFSCSEAAAPARVIASGMTRQKKAARRRLSVEQAGAPSAGGRAVRVVQSERCAVAVRCANSGKTSAIGIFSGRM